MTTRDLLPAAMLGAALLLALTGVLDRAGLDGASRGLGIGAMICAPIWLLSLWRRSRPPREDD